ncbi:MAG: S8 family peptidase [Trueperaceae bacterium]
MLRKIKFFLVSLVFGFIFGSFAQTQSAAGKITDDLQAPNCKIQTCEYLVNLPSRADILDRFTELVTSGKFGDFRIDTSEFSRLLQQETVQQSLLREQPKDNLENAQGLLRYFDVDQRQSSFVGGFFPLYLQASETIFPGGSEEKIDLEQPCSTILATLKDFDKRSPEETFSDLKKLVKELGIDVDYGVNAQSVHSPGQYAGGTVLTGSPFSAPYYTHSAGDTSNVTIAVIDTGVRGVLGSDDPFSSSLAFSEVEGFNFIYNFPDETTEPYDSYHYRAARIPFTFHGTPVAYLASESARKSSGSSPKIWPIKVCDANLTTSTHDDCRASTILIGICYAINNFEPSTTKDGKEERLVINLSLGGTQKVDIIGQALWEGMEKGAVIVTSGGNDRAIDDENINNAWKNSSIQYYPAAFECKPSERNNNGLCPYSYDKNGLIAVSSVDSSHQGSTFNVKNLYNDVAALGEYSSAPLEQRTGTSFAAPVVAGVAAAILEQHPKATPHQVEACIRTIAELTQFLAPTELIGVGIIDPSLSMSYLSKCDF